MDLFSIYSKKMQIGDVITSKQGEKFTVIEPTDKMGYFLCTDKSGNKCIFHVREIDDTNKIKH